MFTTVLTGLTFDKLVHVISVLFLSKQEVQILVNESPQRWLF